jgi:glycosyltransferase involved in cell wall biosynthesis
MEGELSPRKGFAFIVESLGCIPLADRPPLKIACNVVDQQEKRHILDLALRNHVDLELLQGLNMEEMRLLYNRARLCVYAPLMEPFGLVPLEAMACETAVVGVREGGVMESVVHEHTGLLIERELKEFSSAIVHLMRSPALAVEYGKNGRKHVLENWTWERSTAELERYLYEVARQDFHYQGSQ